MRRCNVIRCVYLHSILRIVVAVLLVVFGKPFVFGAWDPIGGIKDGADIMAEPSNPWDGERLLAFGGTLNFAGDVHVDGEIWLQQLNGWRNPAINIPGTLTMVSPSSQFRVAGGADLNIGNASASSVTGCDDMRTTMLKQPSERTWISPSPMRT